jgi:hypothetical protein
MNAWFSATAASVAVAEATSHRSLGVELSARRTLGGPARRDMYSLDHPH